MQNRHIDIPRNGAARRFFWAALGGLGLGALPGLSLAAPAPHAALQSDVQAYVIEGKGADACPADALCLYGNALFNRSNERARILIIPAGATPSILKKYGFDHGFNGVSSLVNNTDHETGLISGMYMSGAILRIAARTAMSNLVEYPLGKGTWNDAARAALVAPVRDAEMPLTLKGPRQALSGEKISYTISVHNAGPEPVADAVVDIGISHGLIGPSLTCTSKNASCGTTGADGRSQALTLAVGDSAEIKIDATVMPDLTDTLTVGAAVKSATVVNTAERYEDQLSTSVGKPQASIDLAIDGPRTAWSGQTVNYTITLHNAGPNDMADASVRVTVPKQLENPTLACESDAGLCGTTSKPAKNGIRQLIRLPADSDAVLTLGGTVKKQIVKNLNVSAALAGSWSDWQSGGQIYSYRIAMTAARDDVRKWRVSFDGLPKGTVIYNKNVLWTRVVEDGSSGKVVLRTPSGGVHVVAAGTPLYIDLQLLYPRQDPAYAELRNLTATQLK